MITSVTTVAGSGGVNICLPLAMTPGTRLTEASAGNLTTWNEIVSLYLAPTRMRTESQSSAMPTDILAECVCLATKSQGAPADRTIWTGTRVIDKWHSTLLAVFYNCTVSDRVQVSAGFEEKHG